MNSKIEKFVCNAFDLIKKRPYLWAFWLAIFLVCTPFIIWICYFIGDIGFIIVSTSLTVGDALGFYGTFLSFLGTIGLGALALWQNTKANKINADILFEQKINIKRPYFAIDSVFYTTGTNGKLNEFYYNNEDNVWYDIKPSFDYDLRHDSVKILNIGEGRAINVDYCVNDELVKNPQPCNLSNVDINALYEIILTLEPSTKYNVKISYNSITGISFVQNLTVKATDTSIEIYELSLQEVKR